MYETAKKNIDGEISVDEAGDLINSYYESKDGRSDVETRTEEADKVSARIAKILSEKAFTFSPTQYLSIHRELFLGIYSHAGKSEIIILQKRNGLLMEIQFLMVELVNFEKRWIMIFLRKGIFAITV